jgi:tetratricopeptide (TPR) repeat protein
MPERAHLRVVLLSLAVIFAMLVAVQAQRAASDAAQSPAPPARVRVWQDTLTLPTYEEGLPDPNPPFDLFTTSRFNYPYTLRQNLTDRRGPRAWRALNLENEYLKCIVLPDLGGHLYTCKDKVNGADLFYANPSIKFARISYRGAWTALGIEFNFPVSHNWMTASPVDFATTTAPDGSASVWIGNVDRTYGMQWRVELTLRPGRAVLEQHTTLYNRSDTRHRFYWWTNAGVEVKDTSRILYPMRFTASHGFADVDTWPVNSAGVDLGLVGNHTFGPVSRFAHGSREPYMAVYHPHTESGIVHYSSPTDLPAKKIWSWSSDADGLDWRRALSDNNSAYVEIQAGLFRNQETYAFLEPQESIHFSEYWLPIRKIGGVSRANTEAVLHLSRTPATGGEPRLRVAFNVARSFPNAAVEVRCGGQPIAKETVSLTPALTFVREYSARTPPAPLAPAPLPAPPCSVVLRDASGRTVLEHTEDVYDYAPASEMTLGAQPAFTYPAPGNRSEGDLLAIGTQAELDGRLLVALETYKDALQRFPDSLDLNRAAGRLAVGLKQYDLATTCLSKVLARLTPDRESAYYLALAFVARGDDRRARTLLEAAQAYGAFRAPALLALAALTSRQGHRVQALDLLQRVAGEQPDAVRAGAIEVALLRTLKRPAAARERLAAWLRRDPTAAALRYEAVRLGAIDPALWRHLAGDPERILEIAVEYIRFGLFDAALDLLARPYPSDGVVSEPGMPRPDAYPLIAYYRAHCRKALEQDPSADLAAAAAMPTRYVFPNRPDTLAVLQGAIAERPGDGTAHFLLGSLYLSGGMRTEALAEWEKARTINPNISVLHRNMGATLLQMATTPGNTAGADSRQLLDRAVTVLKDGTKYDRDNVGLYVALEQAMTLANRPAGERADATLAFPDQKALPPGLVFRLATALAEAGRFDEAERQFRGRFFVREEGGANPRQVYLDVRTRHAVALADAGTCAEALQIVDHLTDMVADLYFTKDGLEPFLKRDPIAGRIGRVRAACGK